MKTSYIFKVNNNISLYNSLPKIKLNSTIFRTSPNIRLEKSIIKSNCIPRINNSMIKNKKNKRYKQNKTIDIIRKLNLESNIRDIYLDEIKKEETREKINNSREVIEQRLGLIKNTELDSEEEKFKENDIKNYNERSIEKLNIKEREKKVEKDYKQGLKDLKIIEEKLLKLDKKIDNLTELIISSFIYFYCSYLYLYLITNYFIKRYLFFN